MVEMDVRLVGDLLEEHAACQVGDADVKLENGLAGGFEVAPTHEEHIAIHTDVDVLGSVGDGWVKERKQNVLDCLIVTGTLKRE